jgi:hypothetical protein
MVNFDNFSISKLVWTGFIKESSHVWSKKVKLLFFCSKRRFFSYLAHKFLGFIRLFKHHTNRNPFGYTTFVACGWKKARQAAYRLHCCRHFKKLDWGHSAIYKKWWKSFRSHWFHLTEWPLWRYLTKNVWSQGILRLCFSDWSSRHFGLFWFMFEKMHEW